MNKLGNTKMINRLMFVGVELKFMSGSHPNPSVIKTPQLSKDLWSHKPVSDWLNTLPHRISRLNT